jgi:hypothetical protein
VVFEWNSNLWVERWFLELGGGFWVAQRFQRCDKGFFSMGL